MNRTITGILAILCYIAAVLGIVILVQSAEIVLLTLLPIGLFLVNNETNFAKYYGSNFRYLGLFILGVFFVGIVGYLGYTWYIRANYFAPLFTTILAIALYLSNCALKP